MLGVALLLAVVAVALATLPFAIVGAVQLFVAVAMLVDYRAVSAQPAAAVTCLAVGLGCMTMAVGCLVSATRLERIARRSLNWPSGRRDRF